MKIICMKCGTQVDFDSNFCKCCGERMFASNVVTTPEEEQLKEIFSAVYNCLVTNSNYSKEEFDREFDNFKHYENRVLTDDQYFQLLVDVMFYSGFKASTVTKHRDQIHQHFPNIEMVVHYTQKDIELISNDPMMIRNTLKIEGCITNAKHFKSIIKTHGSFAKYIQSFGDMTNETSLQKLKSELKKTFEFLGDKTVNHFMMDIGLHVLKPDRVLLRIFSRLGLIVDETDMQGAIKVGRAFSDATGFPIRYIDVIFVLYGQLNQDKITSICTEKNPKCGICEVRRFCGYSKNN